MKTLKTLFAVIAMAMMPMIVNAGNVSGNDNKGAEKVATSSATSASSSQVNARKSTLNIIGNYHGFEGQKEYMLSVSDDSHFTLIVDGQSRVVTKGRYTQCDGTTKVRFEGESAEFVFTVSGQRLVSSDGVVLISE